MNPRLNFPEYPFKIRVVDGKQEIFDSIRMKYVRLSPEEWVRQNLIRYLIEARNYPATLIAVEAGLKVNNMPRRSDILIYNRQAQPLMLIECKAPTVKISQQVFDQAARYNLTINAPYILVSNGLEHYCAQITEGSISFLKDIPAYEQIKP